MKVLSITNNEIHREFLAFSFIFKYDGITYRELQGKLFIKVVVNFAQHIVN